MQYPVVPRHAEKLPDVFTSKKAMLFSGIVCAIPFVFPYAFLLAWVAYVPLACAFFAPHICKRALFTRAFLFAWGFYTVGYSWLGELYPMDYVGFSRIQSFLVILLALTAIPLLHGLLFAVSVLFVRILADFSGGSERSICRPFCVLLFPCAVVLTEYLQSLGTLAFPWCRVYVTQAAFPCLLQSASLFGSYFITYLVLVINALLAYGLCSQKGDKRRRVAAWLLASMLFLGNAVFGICRSGVLTARYDAPETPRITAATLQGNISSSEKWSGGFRSMSERYLMLAENALADIRRKEADSASKSCGILLVTPETALPVEIDSAENPYVRPFSELAVRENATVALGAFSVQDGGCGNSMFFLTPDGSISEPYTKRHLVPFGEYLPYRPILQTLLPALAEINMLSDDLYAGTETAVFPSECGGIGTLICYESIFSPLCRDTVRDGADILIVATNDSWFGASAALRHHLAAAQMRAVENGVSVIRAANTGISALIYPNGRAVQTLGAQKTGYLVGELPCERAHTLYTAAGDTPLAWGCCLAAAAVLLGLRRRRGKTDTVSKGELYA